eukprot:COSAG06_NODE_2122_length_7542_cov_7.066640_3_plen_54_part_00
MNTNTTVGFDFTMNNATGLADDSSHFSHHGLLVVAGTTVEDTVSASGGVPSAT